MIWSDEEEEKEKESDEEKEKEKEKEKDDKKKGNDEEDESDSDERKIRSPKEKIIDLIKDKYHSIKNAIKNITYKTVLESFDELQKNNDKINNLFKKEEVPSYFYECFALIEDLINMSKEEQKKLIKDHPEKEKENNASLNNLKRIFVRISKKIGTSFSEYKKNRKNEEQLEEDLKNIMGKEEKKSDESDDDIDIIELMKRDEDKKPEERRKKWVKKEIKIDEEKKAKKEKAEDDNKIKKPNAQKSKIYQEDDMSKNEKIDEDIPQDVIEKEYDQHNKQRGQNKSSPDVVPRLEYLYTKTSNKLLQIKLLSLLNLVCFDNYTNQFSAFPLNLWDKVYKYIETLIELHDNLKKETPEQNRDIENMSLVLQNNLSTMMEKLENELYKSLQFNIANNADYVNSILNEVKFLKLCKKAEIFYSKLNNVKCISRIYLLVIMHTYYKSNASVKNLVKKNNIKLEPDDYLQKIIIDNDKDYFKVLCNQTYQVLDEENKVKVMLYHIYFLCMRNDYESATRMFDSSNLYELVSVFKNETLKILFNRALAQLSLCAFKNLDLEEVLRYLTPLCTKGPTKLKEYLSQSYNKESEKNTLFDREDKKRAIPYIMKINTDDLDTIFYLSSMINDVPKILLDKIFGNERNDDDENNYNSHAFERIFYNFQRQQFNGPSHVDKDKILSMTTILMKGDWKKCVEEVKKLNLIKKYNYLQDKLFELIKRTALKCYIIFYMNEFQSFELNKLSRRFEIDANEVKNIINDMILRRQIKAKWNDNYLLMKSNDRDSIVNMKKLADNVQIITKQNLELMQAALALANSE